MKRIDAGIRRLGYPQLPLTASRHDVQQYLDDVEIAFRQMPDYALMRKPNSWTFSDLVDYYTGEYNNARDAIVKEVLSHLCWFPKVHKCLFIYLLFVIALSL